jgi:hypothetical protein
MSSSPLAQHTGTKKRAGKNKASKGGASSLFVDNGPKAPRVVVDKAFLEETRTVRPELNDHGVKSIDELAVGIAPEVPVEKYNEAASPPPLIQSFKDTAAAAGPRSDPPIKPSNSSGAATAKKDEWTTATSKNAKKQAAGHHTTTDVSAIGALSVTAPKQSKTNAINEVSQKPSTAPTSTPTKLDGAMRQTRKEDSDGYYMAPAKTAAATPAAVESEPKWLTAQPEPDVSPVEMAEPAPEPGSAAPTSGRKKPTRSQREKMRKEKAKEKAKKEALSNKK